MPSHPGNFTGKADAILSKIDLVEGTMDVLRVEMDKLDKAEFPMAAIHISAAIDQLSLDVEKLQGLAGLTERNGD